VRASQKLVEEMIAAEKARHRKHRARRILPGRRDRAADRAAHRERLAGVLALSTYLPLHKTLEAERSLENRDVPIFMAHGQYDDIIPLARAEQSRQFLERLGYKLQWHTYPMPHSVCPEEIATSRPSCAGFCNGAQWRMAQPSIPGYRVLHPIGRAARRWCISPSVPPMASASRSRSSTAARARTTSTSSG
jgi:hypothetical protein